MRKVVLKKAVRPDLSKPLIDPPIAGHALWSARQVSIYDRLNHIGEGTFGNVFKAELSNRVSSTGRVTPQDIEDWRAKKKFALKRIKIENTQEGFPITALREIKILKRLKHHPNVVSLREVAVSRPSQHNQFKGNVYLVFDYAPADLQGLLDHKIPITMPQIKCLLLQMLEGLRYLHKNNVIHRDIKGANLLISHEGVLKLADFGLARETANPGRENLTNRVVTLWYRAPELLLGETKYSGKIDIWSVGCVLAEMMIGRPLFPGNKEAEQMVKIYQTLGDIDDARYPQAKTLKHWADLKMKEEFKDNLDGAIRSMSKFEVTADCLDFLR